MLICLIKVNVTLYFLWSLLTINKVMRSYNFSLMYTTYRTIYNTYCPDMNIKFYESNNKNRNHDFRYQQSINRRCGTSRL